MEINHYEFKYGEYGETTGIQINLRGFDVLNSAVFCRHG